MKIEIEYVPSYPEVVAEEPTPFETANISSIRERLNVLLGSFSDQEKKALVLRAEGLTYRDMGEEMGVSKARAGQVYQEALRRAKFYASIFSECMKSFCQRSGSPVPDHSLLNKIMLQPRELKRKREAERKAEPLWLRYQSAHNRKVLEESRIKNRKRREKEEEEAKKERKRQSWIDAQARKKKAAQREAKQKAEKIQYMERMLLKAKQEREAVMFEKQFKKHILPEITKMAHQLHKLADETESIVFGGATLHENKSSKEFRVVFKPNEV
jgi:flagellar biosynthesis GTPase FlhF